MKIPLYLNKLMYNRKNTKIWYIYIIFNKILQIRNYIQHISNESKIVEFHRNFDNIL